MESSNLHHHQLHQLQLGGSSSSSSSSSATPSCYGAAPSISLNGSEFNQNYDGVILHSRHKNELIQDHWTGNNNRDSGFKYSHQSVNLAKVKEDLSSEYSFPRFTEMLNSPSSNIRDSHPQPKDLNDLSEKLLLQTISPSFPMFSAGDFSSNRAQNCSSSGSCLPSRSGSFSQIYPSINISTLNQASSSPEIPNSFVNLQALDLLSSARFTSNYFTQPNSLGHMHQQSSNTTVSSPNKISSFPDEITETKRSPDSLPEPKPTQATAKKSRLDQSRNPCPPFKVRKEKLGDRIAALQQLVAPYGKTDTASVLMEAIGYIKFLQNQVETLSVPYMKSSRNKTCISKQGGTTMAERSEEQRRDLKSRGLCLVPLSFMSYVTGDGGGGIWPPPNFIGRT